VVIEVCHENGAHSSAIVLVEMSRGSTLDLARVLGSTVGAGGASVIVDLGECDDAPSDLLTVLHRAAKQLRRLGGRLAVVTSQPDVRRLFDVTLLSHAFGVFASRDEAFEHWT
jgi:anti-anti-sigma factor